MTWAIGHLLEDFLPHDYDPIYQKWSLDHLPILPDRFKKKPATDKTAQLGVVTRLIKQASQIVIATDAPLLPVQCRRLAHRATVGLARVGGYGHESSGDIFIAFSTGNHLGGPHDAAYQVTTLPLNSMDSLFHAAADATEEAVVNALCGARTMTGRAGHVAHALPLDLLVDVLSRHRREDEQS